MKKRTPKKVTVKAALPYADAVRLSMACHRCRAAGGEPCRNYKGQRKAMCPTRGLNAPPAAPEEPAGPMLDVDRPMKQGYLWEVSADVGQRAAQKL